MNERAVGTDLAVVAEKQAQKKKRRRNVALFFSVAPSHLAKVQMRKKKGKKHREKRDGCSQEVGRN